MPWHGAQAPAAPRPSSTRRQDFGPRASVALPLVLSSVESTHVGPAAPFGSPATMELTLRRPVALRRPGFPGVAFVVGCVGSSIGVGLVRFSHYLGKVGRG